MALTTKSVEAAKPGSVRREIPDHDGLYLIVQPSGSKSWAFRYRYRGRPRKLTLGSFPRLGLADARVKAMAARDLVDRGRDPLTTRSDRDLVKHVVAEFLQRHPMRGRWKLEVDRMFRLHVTPRWGEMRIQEITRRDVIELLDGLRDGGMGAGANRVLSVISKLMTWCVARDIIEASPCTAVAKPADVIQRTRRLTDEELQCFWLATDRLGHPFGPMFKLLALTGARLREVAESTWSEYDLDAAVWTLPASRSKSGEQLIRPLSAQALEVLNGVPRIGRYVITSNGKTPSSGFSRAKDRLDREMLKEAEEPIPDWWVHDLRRTMSSWMAQAGIPLQVAEKALGHTSGSLSGVAGIYNVHQYQQEQRDALTAWGAHVVEARPTMRNGP